MWRRLDGVTILMTIDGVTRLVPGLGLKQSIPDDPCNRKRRVAGDLPAKIPPTRSPLAGESARTLTPAQARRVIRNIPQRAAGGAEDALGTPLCTVDYQVLSQ